MTALSIILWIVALALLLKMILDFLFLRPEIDAALERDPAATHPLIVVLMYSGFHAIECYRISRFFYDLKVPLLPRFISQLGRFLTGVEIHPGARIGRGFFIDHGMGVVIGETAVIGKNVTLYQGVTLGGTGKERGKRHPTLGDNVVVGAGAKVLGDITVGDNVFIGANAVVVRDVPQDSTVVGVPGRITSREGRRLPGINLDHTFLPDPLTKSLQKLQHEIDELESEFKKHRSQHKTS